MNKEYRNREGSGLFRLRPFLSRRAKLVLVLVVTQIIMVLLFMSDMLEIVKETDDIPLSNDTSIPDEGFKFFIHPQCGTGKWQHDYAKLHADMLKLPKEQQLITIFDGSKNGAGDRLTMTVTVFLYALISGRAFKIRWQGEPLEDALDYVSINWTYTEYDDDANYGHVEIRDYMTSTVNYYSRDINKLFRRANLLDVGRTAPSSPPFKEYTVTEWRSNTTENGTARTVVWKLNQGQVWTLFDNPHHRAYLYGLGLRPENAFGCIMHYLYQLQPETISLFEDQWEDLLGVEEDVVDYIRSRPGYGIHPMNRVHEGKVLEPTELLVGLQIRFGDYAIREPLRCKSNYTWAEHFFKCSRILSKDIGLPTKILLVTDCSYLREDIQGILSDTQVITAIAPKNSTHRVMHILRPDKNAESVALRWIISEIWMMGTTDFQILSSKSSLGKVGALMSLSWHQIFMFDNYNKEEQVDLSRECGIFNYKSFKDYAHTWVRI
ncbi:hypothetical protein MP638_003160 [Amoeboaphelidium occidentale]|nr:hypothetical protein MP638_003160 [Amoeboaphelidium occidentale]